MSQPLTSTLERLAQMGARLEVDATHILAASAERLVQLSGGNIVFLNAGHYMAATLERLTQMGGGKVTFRFGP